MATNDETTVYPSATSRVREERLALGLTLALHPDLGRIGEIAPLFDLDTGGSAEVSRSAPVFRSVTGQGRSSLDSTLVSRTPVRVVYTRDALRIAHGGRMEVRVDGVLLAGETTLPVEATQRGVVLELGKEVVLLLHPVAFARGETEDFGLRGESLAIREVRRQIGPVAATKVPVLLLGETGSGKELVAHAIHRASARRDAPYAAVNMAAVPSSLAESELFGHKKGAFSGADEDRKGLFEQAQGGTVFLDEIGEVSPDIQTKLLRTLDLGEIQPVGATARTVDFRLVSATDADLERLVEQGRFRRPVLERLRGYTLQVPSLRARRDDIPRLFEAFLRAELASLGKSELLAKPSAKAKGLIPARLMARLLMYSFPGNVRELQKIVQHLLISNAGRNRFELDAALEAQLERNTFDAGMNARPPLAPPALAAAAPQAGPQRRPADLTDAEIVEAMRRNRWNQKRACAELNVSRGWLNTRLDHCHGVRKPKDVGESEIRAAHESCSGDLDRMAEQLEISSRGLALRLGQLGIS